MIRPRTLWLPWSGLAHLGCLDQFLRLLPPFLWCQLRCRILWSLQAGMDIHAEVLL